MPCQHGVLGYIIMIFTPLIVHNMQEKTFATWFDDNDSSMGGYWQRFWRDISAIDNSMAVWLEYNESPNGDNWYPRALEQYGNAIYKTNIPDGATKQFFGRWEQDGTLYLVSNPRHNNDLERQPLTIATSRGEIMYTRKPAFFEQTLVR